MPTSTFDCEASSSGTRPRAIIVKSRRCAMPNARLRYHPRQPATSISRHRLYVPTVPTARDHSECRSTAVAFRRWCRCQTRHAARDPLPDGVVAPLRHRIMRGTAAAVHEVLDGDIGYDGIGTPNRSLQIALAVSPSPWARRRRCAMRRDPTRGPTPFLWRPESNGAIPALIERLAPCRPLKPERIREPPPTASASPSHSRTVKPPVGALPVRQSETKRRALSDHWIGPHRPSIRQRPVGLSIPSCPSLESSSASESRIVVGGSPPSGAFISR